MAYLPGVGSVDLADGVLGEAVTVHDHRADLIACKTNDKVSAGPGMHVDQERDGTKTIVMYNTKSLAYAKRVSACTETRA